MRLETRRKPLEPEKGTSMPFHRSPHGSGLTLVSPHSVGDPDVGAELSQLLDHLPDLQRQLVGGSQAEALGREQRGGVTTGKANGACSGLEATLKPAASAAPGSLTPLLATEVPPVSPTCCCDGPWRRLPSPPPAAKSEQQGPKPRALPAGCIQSTGANPFLPQLSLSLRYLRVFLGSINPAQHRQGESRRFACP